MRKYHLQISLVKESNFIDRKFDLTIYVSVLNHVRSILAVVYVCMCTIQIQKQFVTHGNCIARRVHLVVTRTSGDNILLPLGG